MQLPAFDLFSLAVNGSQGASSDDRAITSPTWMIEN